MNDVSNPFRTFLFYMTREVFSRSQLPFSGTGGVSAGDGDSEPLISSFYRLVGILLASSVYTCFVPCLTYPSGSGSPLHFLI